MSGVSYPCCTGLGGFLPACGLVQEGEFYLFRCLGGLGSLWRFALAGPFAVAGPLAVALGKQAPRRSFRCVFAFRLIAVTLQPFRLPRFELRLR